MIEGQVFAMAMSVAAFLAVGWVSIKVNGMYGDLLSLELNVREAKLQSKRLSSGIAELRRELYETRYTSVDYREDSPSECLRTGVFITGHGDNGD